LCLFVVALELELVLARVGEGRVLARTKDPSTQQARGLEQAQELEPG
jgi:hypothetical protein